MRTEILSTVAIAALAQQALAFPSIAHDFNKKGHTHKKRINGLLPGFDANAQRIDVSGAHAFLPPGHGDMRGPCPGLNALANHNYLPHNGVATIEQFVNATNSVFGMGLDLALFLSTYGAVMDGDLTSWSIGGPTSGVNLLPGILSQPQGISGSHNKYETDGSPTRGDLYEYGNDYLVQLSQFQALYNTQAGVDNSAANYDLDLLTNFRVQRIAQSKANNPYFFSAPVAGVIVQPAAYTFIYRFMANKSAEYPEGILNKEVLKSFFSITGDDNNLQYTPGNERIPENWYKRAIGDEYTIPFYATDLNLAALEHPEFLEIGGNTGTTNSFVGLDISNLTGGVFNAQNLLKGNNLACFGFQAAIQFAPDLLQGLVSDVTGAVNKLTSSLGNTLNVLGCPTLKSVDDSQFSQFPGYSKLKADGTY